MFGFEACLSDSRINCGFKVGCIVIEFLIVFGHKLTAFRDKPL